MHAAIEKISVHENCRFNGANHFHVRVYISFEQAVQLAEEVRIAFETTPVPPHCLGSSFKIRGLAVPRQPIEIIDARVSYSKAKRHRRARHVAIGAEDAAIALVWFEQRSATRALIKVLAGIAWHRLGGSNARNGGT